MGVQVDGSQGVIMGKLAAKALGLTEFAVAADTRLGLNGRKRMEEKVRREREFTLSLLKGLVDGFAVVDETGRQILVNDMLCTMTGYSEEELLNQRPPFKYWADEGLNDINDTFEKTLRGVEGEYELIFKRKDGERFVALVSPRQTVDSNGNKLFFATVKDITERTQIETELQRNAERFQISVENMLDCFGIYSAIRDENGRIVDFLVEYVNEAACSNNQMTKEQQIGKRLLELLPAHRKTGLFDEYCQVVETGEPLTKESLIYEDIYGNQGWTRVFDIRATKLGDGFAVAWRDITARKRAVEEVKRSNEFSRAVLNSMPDAVCVINVYDFRIVGANRAFLKQLGLTLEQAVGRTCYQVTHGRTEPCAPPHDVCPLVQVVAGAKHSLTEHVHFTANGEKVYVEVSATPIFDENGGVRRVVHVARDITERKRAAEEMQHLNQALRYRLLHTVQALAAAVDAKDPFTGGHSEQVSEFAVAVARQLGLHPEEIEDIRIAGLLHDIGKIGIPLEILDRPRALTAEERALVRTHVQLSSKILENADLSPLVKQAVFQHHERYDGTGYPVGLKGDQISLGGRILALADALEAMTSNRPHRARLRLKAVVAEIQRGMETQFDPRVAEAALSLLAKGGVKQLKMVMLPDFDDVVAQEHQAEAPS